MGKAKTKATATKAESGTYAYSIYEPINGHLSGKGSLAFCKDSVRTAYPEIVFVDQEATGRVLCQKDGGNVAVITLLTPTE